MFFINTHSLDSENFKNYTIWLFAITIIVILAGIGLRDPWPPDEPRFALMAKEMWETGQWFFPHRGGEIYPDKPPLVMWLILFFYALTGSLKTAFLLPSALLSIGTLWLTYDISKRLWNPKIGLYAGFLLAISLHFILQAKSGQLDSPVAFWIMLASYGLLRHLILGPAWNWYYLSFFAMGIGIITKGVGFLPILMFFAFIKYPPLWFDKNNKQLIKWFLGILFLLLAVSLWLIPMLIQVEINPTTDVLAYRDNILFKQTVNRYTKSWAHIQPFYFYIIEVIPLFWLPLSVFIPWLIKPFIKAFKTGERRIIYPLIMVIIVILFFSLSKGKRAEYMLPILPLFVITLAPHFEMLIKKKEIQRLLFVLISLTSILFTIIGFAGIFEFEKISKLTNQYNVNPWFWLAFLGILGVIITLVFYKQIIKMYTIFVICMWLSYSLWAMPLVDKAMSTESMMDAISDVIPSDAELGIVGMREKLLLHTKWETTHFGHHIAIKQQQQAAINWIKQKENRFLLVNINYINHCFKGTIPINYSSIHQTKWILYSNKKIVCQVNSIPYKEFKVRYK